MNGPFNLALRYVAYHKYQSLVLIACMFLTAFLPIAIGIMLTQFNQKIVARASSTPLVIGARGSRLDLTLHTLYFQNLPPDEIGFSEVAKIRQGGLARAIPIHARFTARKYPVVGTSLEYFDFRGLSVTEGEMLTKLGDCILGAQVARELELGPGDQLLSDRENILDIAGLYPLKMHVRGVLTPSQSPDDWAVFVDLKTAWIIEGLGHGHQDLSNENDEVKILSRDEDKIVASAAVLPYTAITDKNIESFHFHGDTGDFPVTAVIAIAPDEKSATLLIGQYQTDESGPQLVLPLEVVQQLMDMVFRVKKFFDANAVLIACSTLLLLALVVILSLRLRKREMETMFKLGSSRRTIALLQFWELGIIFVCSTLLVSLAVWFVWHISGNLVQSLLLGS